MTSELQANESAGLLHSNQDDVETGLQTSAENPALDAAKAKSGSDDSQGGDSTLSPADQGLNQKQNSNQYRPSLVFLFFRCHNLMGVFSLLLMALAQGFPSPHKKIEVISMLQEFYILLACAIGAVTELELSQWLIDRVAPILQDWLARGAFYLFLAVIATEESTVDVDDTKIHKDDGLAWTGQHLTALLLNIAAGGLLVSGLLYIIMGLFCLKGLKERCERENDERLRMIIRGQTSPTRSNATA